MSLAVEPLALQKLDSVTFDTLLEHQNPFGQPGGVFDLTGVELVTPAALVQLAAACHALAEDGRQPVVVVPALGVRTYLLRAGFGRAVESVGRIEPPALSPASRLYERRRGTNPMLIEVQKIEA